jgi:ubiquinone/menaquinone biosynthesis C-methylase UbiE
MNQSDDHRDSVVRQFSYQAEGYSGLTASVSATRLVALWELVTPRSDDLALDICCGPGALTLDLARYVEHVTGLDLTPAMLEQARARQASVGVDNVDWVVGDANQIPFPTARFSLVSCSSAFHHLADPARVFNEMVRVCSPGGRIIVKDVTPAPEKVEAYDSMEKMRDPSHTHALTLEELRALGFGLPLQEVVVSGNVVANMPLEAILAISFPEQCSREEIRALFREDALCGQDRLGFGATLIDGAIRVSYPMSTVMWRRS